SDGNEFASISLPMYGQLEESCALSLWKTNTLEIIQVIGCEDDVLLDLCWQRFRMRRQTYSCLYSASRYGKLRKYNLPLFEDQSEGKSCSPKAAGKAGEIVENAFVPDEEIKELKTKTQALFANTNCTSKHGKLSLITNKMEIIENGLCMAVPRQVDALIGELILLRRMYSEDLTVEQLDDKRSVITWRRSAALKFRIKTILSLEERMEGFTHVIIQIMNEESYLSVNEVETILKMLSDETASIDMSLEKEPILPSILQNLFKIVASMEIFAPRSLDIPQRPEVHFCKSASSESGSHSVVLEATPAVPPKSTLSSPLLSTSYDRWIPSPRTCGARFNGSGFLVIFGQNELAIRRMQSSKSSFQDESLWLSAERITHTLKGTSSKKGQFVLLDYGHEADDRQVSSTPRSLDECKHELLLSMEDMRTRLQNPCGHEKCSSPLCQSISGTPFFSHNMAFSHQKFDISNNGAFSQLGMRASNSLVMLNSICSNSTQNVRSYRHRGNSGTNVLADDHHHLDGFAPISIVVIYDVSVLMSVSKNLARKYRLLRSFFIRLIGADALELCLWNRKMVKEAGRKDLENIWQIVEYCVRMGKSSWRKRCFSDQNKTLSNVDPDSSDESVSEEDSIAVAVHPFGRSLINSLLDYFARINNYQTAAVIICVLGLRNKRNFEIINSSVESSATTSCAVHHENSCSICGSFDSSAYSSMNANAKSDMDFRLLQQGKEKPDMREQPSLTAAASKTARKFSSLFQNALIGHHSIQALKIEQDSKTSHSRHILDTSMSSDIEQHGQDHAWDVIENKSNLYSLLDPLFNDRFDEVRHQYASLLFRWRMFSKAAEVMKYIKSAPYSPPLRDMLTVCALCGHGGHSEHVVIWFKENNRCAYGCGCDCKSACF
ncbi:unnamed protein product, partial [Litomosoides sigmodontis]